MNPLPAKLFCALAVLALLSTAGCYQEPNISDIPRISFAGISKISEFAGNGYTGRDSVFITIGFQDGDGDIGSRNQEPNFRFESIERKTGDGQYEVISLPDNNLNYDAVIPQAVNPEDDGSAIEGELTITVYPLTLGIPQFDPTFSIGDSIRFSVYIVDRAGNFSNTVTTGDVVLGP